jgi:pyruvate formate lyase activating enzyme
VEDNHSFVGGTGGLLLHNTGGEPTLQPDLPEFMAKLKQLGLEVMMETNGSRPETIRTITDCELRILDYLSLDFKTRFVDYPQVVRNRHFDVRDWQKSLQLMIASKIPLEIRTTIVPTIHHQEVLTEMAQELNSQLVNSLNKSILPIWYWQPFVPRNCLDPKFNKIKPYAKIEIEKFLEAVKKFPFRVKLR